MQLRSTICWAISPPAATPTGIFLARQYMMTIPNSLIEVARINGDGEWFIFQRIILPLAKQINATIAIFSFMCDGMIFSDRSLPLHSRSITYSSWIQQILSASMPLTGQSFSPDRYFIIPPVAVFLLFQKYFIKGITSGGVEFCVLHRLSTACIRQSLMPVIAFCTVAMVRLAITFPVRESVLWRRRFRDWQVRTGIVESSPLHPTQYFSFTRAPRNPPMKDSLRQTGNGLYAIPCMAKGDEASEQSIA